MVYENHMFTTDISRIYCQRKPPRENPQRTPRKTPGENLPWQKGLFSIFSSKLENTPPQRKIHQRKKTEKTPETILQAKSFFVSPCILTMTLTLTVTVINWPLTKFSSASASSNFARIWCSLRHLALGYSKPKPYPTLTVTHGLLRGFLLSPGAPWGSLFFLWVAFLSGVVSLQAFFLRPP